MQDEKFEYTVKDEEADIRVREILKRRLGFSSRLMRKVKNDGGVACNGQPVKMNEKIKVGDRITVSLPKEESHFTPEPIPIDIVYEDEDLLLINKQPGYVVHPTKGHPCHTIANGIMDQMLKREQQYKIRFINRLDMDTSGLLAIAKNAYGQDDLAKQMEEGVVVKKYVALVRGIIKEESGTIDLPIGKEQEDQVKRAVVEDGAPSVTHYRVLERFAKGYSLIEVILETGRTHQIRVHMTHIGYPIVGDVLYGKAEVFLIERQALHAQSLSFFHPVTKAPIEVNAPLPADLTAALNKIR